MKNLNLKVSEELYSKIQTAAEILNQPPADAAREFLDEHTDILLFDEMMQVSAAEIEGIRRARRNAVAN